jgi:hypothetical protein
MSCSCPPSASIACTSGHAYQIAFDLRARFLAHVLALRDECDPDDEDRLLNRLGRCPYPGRGFEILTPCNLKDYFDSMWLCHSCCLKNGTPTWLRLNPSTALRPRRTTTQDRRKRTKSLTSQTPTTPSWTWSMATGPSPAAQKLQPM